MVQLSAIIETAEDPQLEGLEVFPHWEQAQPIGNIKLILISVERICYIVSNLPNTSKPRSGTTS